jgi:hypothetical protein
LVVTTGPSRNWENLINDVDAEVPQSVREQMLDLVLAWAELDGAISMMASAMFGLNPTTGSLLMGKMRANEKLEKVVRLHKAFEQSEGARAFKKFKTEYEKLSRSRNLIAHSKCIGVVRTDPSSLLFATFEAEKQLAIDQVSMGAIKSEIIWAKRSTAKCFEIIDKSSFFDQSTTVSDTSSK